MPGIEGSRRSKRKSSRVAVEEIGDDVDSDAVKATHVDEVVLGRSRKSSRVATTACEGKSDVSDGQHDDFSEPQTRTRSQRLRHAARNEREGTERFASFGFTRTDRDSCIQQMVDVADSDRDRDGDRDRDRDSDRDDARDTTDNREDSDGAEEDSSYESASPPHQHSRRSSRQRAKTQAQTQGSSSLSTRESLKRAGGRSTASFVVPESPASTGVASSLGNDSDEELEVGDETHNSQSIEAISNGGDKKTMSNRLTKGKKSQSILPDEGDSKGSSGEEKEKKEDVQYRIQHILGSRELTAAHWRVVCEPMGESHNLTVHSMARIPVHAL